MSLSDAKIVSSHGYTPYVTAGTITIPVGSQDATSPIIPGLSENSIISVTYMSGVDNGVEVVWNSVVNNPTPQGPVITIGAAAVAVDHDLLFSYIVFRL